MPQEAEKLANVLNELKTTNFKPFTNRPLKRISATLVVLIIGLVFGIYMIAMNYLSHQARDFRRQAASRGQLWTNDPIKHRFADSSRFVTHTLILFSYQIR